MLRRIILSSGVLALILVLAECSDKPTVPPLSPEEELQLRLAETPRDNSEAEEMALWVSQELTAPEWLYRQFDKYARKLRRDHRDEVPLLWWTHFRIPHEASKIVVMFDYLMVYEVQLSKYSAWDSLNALYRVTDIEFYKLGLIPFARLSFEGVIHPDSLASYYRDLEWVDGVGVVPAEKFGKDYGNLYPGYVDGGVRFLLREAWDECIRGCIQNNFWYFEESGDELEKVGEFYFDFSGPPPEWWWIDASDVFCSYRHLNGLCREY